MSHALSIAVIASAAWAVLALSAQLVQLASFGRKVYFSPPAADPRRAVTYAFTAGMLPTAKESVRTHVPVYFAGVGFHLGVASAILTLGFDLARVDSGRPASILLAAGCLFGGLAGVLLFGRRAASPWLRTLSTPDDYVSNLLCTAFLLLGGGRLLAPGLSPAFDGAAVLLFAYVPIGKIRHCVFFFSARYHSACFFGRRGAYPPRA